MVKRDVKGLSIDTAPPPTTIESVNSTGSTGEWWSPSQTIIIFDWDDTLCPSTWIRHNRPVLSYFRPPPKEDRFVKPLAEFEGLVCKLLEQAMQMGKVIIVTNAKEPWVTTSCVNFMPRVLPLLEHIPVVYAQSVWESCGVERSIMSSNRSFQANDRVLGSRGMRKQPSGFIPLPLKPAQDLTPKKGLIPMSPNENRNSNQLQDRPHSFYGDTPQARNRIQSLGAKLFSSEMMQTSPHDICLMWKELSFGIEITEFYSRYQGQPWKNVISIGDAEYERTAAKRVFESCSPSSKDIMRVKTLKMFEEPTVSEVIEQTKKIIESLRKIVLYDGKLDIEIDEKDLGIHVPEDA